MKHDERIPITKVQPRQIQRLEYDEPTMLYRRAPNVDEVTEPRKRGLTLWQKITLLPYLYTILKGAIMGDLKTTISGVVKVSLQIATLFGLAWGHVDESLITGVLWGVVSIYQSFVTADKK
jgi:hypothetical protein